MAHIIQLVGCFFNGSESAASGGKCERVLLKVERKFATTSVLIDTAIHRGGQRGAISRLPGTGYVELSYILGCAFRLHVVQSGPLRGYDNSPFAVPEAGSSGESNASPFSRTRINGRNAR